MSLYLDNMLQQLLENDDFPSSLQSRSLTLIRDSNIFRRWKANCLVTRHHNGEMRTISDIVPFKEVEVSPQYASVGAYSKWIDVVMLPQVDSSFGYRKKWKTFALWAAFLVLHIIKASSFHDYNDKGLLKVHMSSVNKLMALRLELMKV